MLYEQETEIPRVMRIGIIVFGGLNSMNPSGHTVLITGGATGIGFAIARTFHAAGNRVVVVGRREDKLAAAAAALPGINTCAADVSSAVDRETLVRTYSNISILVNNAGIQNIVPILESTPHDIENEIDVNFLSPVLLCRAFLPLLLQREVCSYRQCVLRASPCSQTGCFDLLCIQGCLAQLLEDFALAT